MKVDRFRREILKGPNRAALALAIGYVTVTITWILFSAEWAQVIADGDIEIFKLLSRYQDIAFVTTKAIAIYFFSRLIFQKTANSAKRLVQSEERRLEAERNAVPALLAASVAHDVANLLTVLRLNIERIKQIRGTPEEALKAVGKLDRSTDRLTDLVQRLRGASRSLFRDRPQRFNFSATVKDTIEMMYAHASVKNSIVEFRGPEIAFLSGYPVLVHQLIMNLVINAAEAGDGHATIKFTVDTFEGGVRLIAEDDGPGIPPTLRESILSAFFTTKANGTGLGLMSVRTCVDIHNGVLEIGDSELGGAKFSIKLPHLDQQRMTELRNPELAATVDRMIETAEA